MFADEDKLETGYRDAFQAWKSTPTPQTSGKLLTAVRPVIDTALRSYGGSGAQSPNLRSRARQMTLQAFQTYDPYQGSIKTHLLSQLRGLQRHSAQEQQIIRIPEQVGLDYQHLLSSENELRDQLGRDPSDAEIGDHTGLSAKRLAYIRQSRGSVAEGTFSPAGSTAELPASQGVNNHEEEDAWTNFVYADLGPVDRVVLDYSLGRNGSPKLSTQQIAQRLGVTSGAISQRTAKLQALLDSRHELGGI